MTIVIEMTVGTVVTQKQNYEDKEEEKRVRKIGYTKSVMAKKTKKKNLLRYNMTNIIFVNKKNLIGCQKDNKKKQEKCFGFQKNSYKKIVTKKVWQQ